MTTYSPVTKAQLTLVSGPAVSGKTTELLARVKSALNAGAKPSEMLVLAPSATAAQALSARVQRELGDGMSNVRVTTPREVALEVLATPEAFAVTHRRAHVLTEVEHTFFLQDMLVMGKRNNRLRELLKFLERGWSELREEDDDWLITVEEHEVNDFAKSRLSFLEALHPAEVSAEAVRYLAHAPQALAAAGVAHVFVDDARSMSRASQVLACLLAQETLVVTWQDNAALTGGEPYAYEDGAAEMLEANPQAEHIELTQTYASRAVAQAVENVLAQPAFGDPRIHATVAEGACEGAFSELKSPDLSDEMGAIAQAISERIAAGTAPEDIFVACPSDAWARRVTKALHTAGIVASSVDAREAIGGNVRDTNRNLAARVYTALALVANPENGLAWRCWCGFGEYLTCSTAFAQMLNESKTSGQSLLKGIRALAALSDDELKLRGSESIHIVESYRAGLKMIKATQGLSGTALLQTIAREVGHGPVPSALSELVGQVDDGETAQAIFARVERALTQPVFASNGVRVGGYEQLVGQEPQVLIFAGMVNGLIPEHRYFDLTEATVDEQAKLRHKLVRRLYGAAGRARREIVCSTFGQAQLEQAETLHLDASRVHMQGAIRVSRLSPSVCVGYLSGSMVAER